MHCIALRLLSEEEEQTYAPTQVHDSLEGTCETAQILSSYLNVCKHKIHIFILKYELF